MGAGRARRSDRWSPAVFLYAYSVLVASAHVAARDAVAAASGTVHSIGRWGPEKTGPLIGWFMTASDAVASPTLTWMRLGPLCRPRTIHAPWPIGDAVRC